VGQLLTVLSLATMAGIIAYNVLAALPGWRLRAMWLTASGGSLAAMILTPPDLPSPALGMAAVNWWLAVLVLSEIAAGLFALLGWWLAESRSDGAALMAPDRTPRGSVYACRLEKPSSRGRWGLPQLSGKVRRCGLWPHTSGQARPVRSQTTPTGASSRSE
jgi:hypothetical protein